MIESMKEYLPLRVMRWPTTNADDPDFESVVLAEVAEHDGGMVELAFSVGRQRFYIAIRHDDLPRLNPDPEAGR